MERASAIIALSDVPTWRAACLSAPYSYAPATLRDTQASKDRRRASRGRCRRAVADGEQRERRANVVAVANALGSVLAARPRLVGVGAACVLLVIFDDASQCWFSKVVARHHQ
jgi:hypothetical protein